MLGLRLTSLRFLLVAIFVFVGSIANASTFLERFQPLGTIYGVANQLFLEIIQADDVISDPNIANPDRRSRIEAFHRMAERRIADIRTGLSRVPDAYPGLPDKEAQFLVAIQGELFRVVDAIEAHIADQSDIAAEGFLGRLGKLSEYRLRSLQRRITNSDAQIVFGRGTMKTVPAGSLDFHYVAFNVALQETERAALSQQYDSESSDWQSDPNRSRVLQRQFNEALTRADQAISGSAQQVDALSRARVTGADPDVLRKLVDEHVGGVELRKKIVATYRAQSELIWGEDGRALRSTAEEFAPVATRQAALFGEFHAKNQRIVDLAARLFQPSQQN